MILIGLSKSVGLSLFVIKLTVRRIMWAILISSEAILIPKVRKHILDKETNIADIRLLLKKFL